MFSKTFWVSAAACALWFAAAASPQTGGLDYPLAPNTRWTYHLRQELGPGVHFGAEDARLAKGNVLDTTVISEVAGSDVVGGLKYTRVESRRDGKLWLAEWYRLGPQGLMLGKRLDSSGGGEMVMAPPQRRLSLALQPGESWTWKSANAPLVYQTAVDGPAATDVPAGHFQATRLSMRGTIGIGGGTVDVRQTFWYVRGTGYVKQDTVTSISGHLLSHVVLTLERFDRPGQ
jgi:hypothetical protein